MVVRAWLCSPCPRFPLPPPLRHPRSSSVGLPSALPSPRTLLHSDHGCGTSAGTKRGVIQISELGPLPRVVRTRSRLRTRVIGVKNPYNPPRTHRFATLTYFAMRVTKIGHSRSIFTIFLAALVAALWRAFYRRWNLEHIDECSRSPTLRSALSSCVTPPWHRRRDYDTESG